MTPNRYALASIWLGVVVFLGTAYFAATNTAPFILPLLKKLAPGGSNAQLHAIHRGGRRGRPADCPRGDGESARDQMRGGVAVEPAD